MFWNRLKKTKAPYEEPKEPSLKMVFAPTNDITIHELIVILQHYISGVGPVLPTGEMEVPHNGYLPEAVMRHLKEV